MTTFLTKNYRYYKSLIKVGIPIVIGQIGMIILSFADTLMIGQHSTNELAAASFVNSIFNLFIIMAMGFSYGLTPIIGSLYGKGETNAIGRILKNSLFANTILAMLIVIVTSILYINLHRLGQPLDILPIMRPYFIVILISIFFVMIFNGFKQFADGITDTSISMWILLGGNVINIAGNYILIYGKLGLPEMGLLGAGVSTLISRIIMVIVFMCFFFESKRYNKYSNGFKTGRINRSDFISLNKIGWPIALQMGMETASFSLSTIMVGWLGTVELAAHQIMLTVSQLFFMMYYGMGAAVAIKTSNYMGQNDYKSVMKSASSGFKIILAIAVFVAIPIYLYKENIGLIFTDSNSVNFAVMQLIFPLLIYQFGDGLQCNYANALRGIADVKPVMFYAFIAYFVVSLPLGYFFGFILGWGLFGIWMAFPFGLTTAGILYYIRFRWKMQKIFANYNIFPYHTLNKTE